MVSVFSVIKLMIEMSVVRKAFNLHVTVSILELLKIEIVAKHETKKNIKHKTHCVINVVSGHLSQSGSACFFREDIMTLTTIKMLQLNIQIHKIAVGDG